MSRRLERGGRLRHGGVYGDDVVSPGGGPPTYTAKGPPAPQLLTGVMTAIAGASVTTAPFNVLQKAIVTCSVTLSIGAGVQDNVALEIFDGTPATPIDSFAQSVGNSAIEVAEFNTVSWTLEVPGNGLARTFGLAASEVVPGTVTVSTNNCRTVVQIVDG